VDRLAVARPEGELLLIRGAVGEDEIDPAGGRPSAPAWRAGAWGRNGT
jgi:hypothetical protein